MTVSTRTRFEVFKRDRFACSYCGRTPPTVLLHVDHVIPRAAGGTDDMANLTTACDTCNLGKAAVLLEEGTAPIVGRQSIEELQERLEQARAYMELLAGVEAVRANAEQQVVDRWAIRYDASKLEKADGTYWQLDDGQFPKRASIKAILNKLSLEDVLDAVDVTANRFDSPDWRATRYFFGVCWRAIKEGRRVLDARTVEPEPVSFDQQVLSARRDRPDDAVDPRIYLDDGRMVLSPEEWAIYDLGVETGTSSEHERLRSLFVNHIDNGFERYADVVDSLWPD